MYSGSHVGYGRLPLLLALLCIWAGIHAGLLAFGNLSDSDNGFSDPDSYMRLVRVSELMQGWQWFDTSIARANAPYGDVLHWTRPFDLMILLLALPIGIAFEAQQALYYAGLFISPLLQLATALLLIWALRPVIRPDVWFLPAVAFFLQPGALAYALVGRADHHTLMLLVFVVVAGFMLRALRNPLDCRPAAYAGLAAGFGIWLSVEFLLIVAVCLLSLGLPWLFGERERAAQNKWFALAMSGLMLVALFVELPLADLLDASYDRVSSAQYLLAVSVLVFWRVAEVIEARDRRGTTFASRALFGAAGVGAIATLMTLVYPLFFSGPMAGVDPRIVPIWLDRVLEMRPLLPYDRQTVGRLVLYLGGMALIALPFLRVLIAERGSPRFFAHLFIAIGCLLLTLAALRHLRFVGYAELAFIAAFAVVLDGFLRWTGRIAADLLRGLLRGGFISLMLIGPLLVGGTLMVQPGKQSVAAAPPAGCDLTAVADYLATDPRWGARPHTIQAFMDIGPELLYRTHHSVVGTPYHRNSDGIYDGYRMLATDDDGAARALAERRGIDLVLLCGTPAEQAFYAAADGKENLYSRLAAGSPPDWLAEVALPAPLRGSAQLYATLR